jgi:predicted nucleic acid-binding protein
VDSASAADLVLVYVAMAERLGQRLLTADAALVTRVNLPFDELNG